MHSMKTPGYFLVTILDLSAIIGVLLLADLRARAADVITNQPTSISNTVAPATTPAVTPPRGGGGFGGNNPATAQDHQRIMELLKITSIRRGRDGNNPQSTNYANYDESKANPFPNLPDPLLLKNGQKVTTAEMLSLIHI